ncbi:PKD domain-containing protein [[Eubacterium] cellulosolvens]
MRHLTKMLLAVFICLGMLAGSASAASYSDADGDGNCEPNEEITFVGDYSYIDDQGNEHLFHEWYWDTDNDGVWDMEGQIITLTFPAEGEYTVTLLQINDEGKIEEIKINVKADDPAPHHCFKFKKIKKILKWLKNNHIPDKIKIKLIIKHMKKNFDEDIDLDNLEEIKEYILEFIDNYKSSKRKCNCK